MAETGENVICYLRHKLKKDCPHCELEIFYDEKNLSKYEKRLESIIEDVIDIIKCICSYKSGICIYIRIHGYKQWCIFRIRVEDVFRKVFIDDLIKRRSKDRDSNMFNITKEHGATLIKIVY